MLQAMLHTDRIFADQATKSTSAKNARTTSVRLRLAYGTFLVSVFFLVSVRPRPMVIYFLFSFVI